MTGSSEEWEEIFSLFTVTCSLFTVKRCVMIKVSRLDGTEYFINPHQIECIEIRPDTMLVMLSGKTYIVRENADVVLERIAEYRRRLLSPPIIQE